MLDYFDNLKNEKGDKEKISFNNEFTFEELYFDDRTRIGECFTTAKLENLIDGDEVITTFANDVIKELKENH